MGRELTAQPVCRAPGRTQGQGEADLEAIYPLLTMLEEDDGGTKVTFIFNPQLGDFWGYVPKSIVRRIYNRTLKQNMTRLKRVLEKEK